MATSTLLLIQIKNILRISRILYMIGNG